MRGLGRDVFPRRPRGIHIAGWHPAISVQGLSNALADVGEGIDETPVEEYAMMLEVTMADCPGQPRPLHSLGTWEW